VRRGTACHLMSEELFNFKLEFCRIVVELADFGGTRLCDKEEAAAIVAKAKDRFVRGSPRSWWYSLKCTPRTYHYPDGDGFLHLAEHAPPGTGQCWLILETEEKDKPVAKMEIEVIPRVIGELPCIEYYVVDENFSWLMVETHHNAILVCEDDSER
jgi:hypothetical protein